MWVRPRCGLTPGLTEPVGTDRPMTARPAVLTTCPSEPGKGVYGIATASSDERPRPRRAKNAGGPITEATTATDRSSDDSSPRAAASGARVGVVLVDAAAHA